LMPITKFTALRLFVKLCPRLRWARSRVNQSSTPGTALIVSCSMLCVALLEILYFIHGDGMRLAVGNFANVSTGTVEKNGRERTQRAIGMATSQSHCTNILITARMTMTGFRCLVHGSLLCMFFSFFSSFE